MMREGISSLLTAAGDIEVVGEAANGSEALKMVQKLAPDVVLLDITMPIVDGLEATRKMRREFPGTKVLALSEHEDKEYVFLILDAGASGFISKAGTSPELTTAIRSVHKGDSFLSPSIARLLVEDYQRGTGRRAAQDPYQQLTDREREILKLVAEGYTTQEIAEMLTLSPKTVDGHRTNLMDKLDIHGRIELVKYALRKGIITV